MKKIIPVVLILISVCAICVISCEKDPSFVRGNYVCKDSVLTPTGPQVPTVTTAEVTDISRTSAKCGGKLVSTGGSDVTSYGVCLSKTPHSIAAASNSNDGQHIGSFSSVLQNLTPGTHYYVRAYATNKVGTGYGEEFQFTTKGTSVTTSEVNNVSDYEAECGGVVISDVAIHARGVCWNVSSNPTVGNNHTTNGSDTGSFISNITGLSPNTTYYVRAYVTSSDETIYGQERVFKTSSNNNPTVTTAEVSNITATTATSGGYVSVPYGGPSVIQRGVCWSASQNPTNSNSHTIDGGGVGSFTSSITGLSPNTTYYVRAYATTNYGTVYGQQRVLTTTSATVPIVTTNSVTNITTSSATSGGNVTFNGGAPVTARGVCWNTSQNPTLSGNHVSNGSGTGNFTSNISGLLAGTTYYVRAYATNSAGTAYGEQRSFTTSTSLPAVITNEVINIGTTSANCGGNVTSSGGTTVTARGVCWSTSQNPTLNNSHTTSGSGIGNFTSSITGLSPNTTYYVRAYATNGVGTAYGSNKVFTTTINCPTMVQDYDNNTYNTIVIGNQCWMKENLRTTHYSNGTSITLGSTTSLTTAYRYYPNNISSNVTTYGYLYNWKAVMRNSSSSSANPSGVQGVCPSGWHVPSDPEWSQMTDYVKSQSTYLCDNNNTSIAKSLASSTGDWTTSTVSCAIGNQVNTNNSTGFNALPAGVYNSGATYYYGIGGQTAFWTSSESGSTTAWLRSFHYNYSAVVRSDAGYGYNSKNYGLSVRCVKD